MTYEQTREQFLLAWNSNAYLNMCTSDDMINVINALEKQIPKKPYIQQTEIHDYDIDCFECPSCDSFIGYVSDYKDEHYRIPYCSGCGQMIDWSEVNEM